MEILSKPCGSYQANCYLAIFEEGELIIDPGDGAFEWVKKIVKNPLAILNTHGHFDHVWDNKKIKEAYNIPIYAPKKDAFMLSVDILLGIGIPISSADVECEEGSYEVGGVKFEFLEFAGHTPGCSVIRVQNALFSGDFVFKGSIGRIDFPYSSPADMKKSLKRFLQLTEDLAVYPGHGDKTSVFKEKQNVEGWLEYLG